jgi:hypothetical protein
MPTINPTLESPVGSFDLKARVKLNYTDVTVSKWQSRDSGLTVVHLDYDGERHASYSIPNPSSWTYPSPVYALMMR